MRYFQKSSLRYHRLLHTLISIEFTFSLNIFFFSAILSYHSLSIGFGQFVFKLTEIGRFESLVDSPLNIELFKQKYNILQEVDLRYYSTEQIVTDRETGEVIIPMIAFIEGGMTIPMGRITRDYLIAHRLCPHQCAPNMFRILGCIDALNGHLQLGLTWHDMVHMYEFHSQSDGGYYLKSQSAVVRLISCLPKSNKWMKDDYLIVSGP